LSGTMKYFLLETTGDLNNEDQLFIDGPPQGMGLIADNMSIGEPVRPYYKQNIHFTIDADNHYRDICDILGNSRSYIIVSQRTKDILLNVLASSIALECISADFYDESGVKLISDYFIINPLGEFDCLHEDASGLICDENGIILEMKAIVLDRVKIEHAPPLFRIAGKPTFYIFNLTLGLALKQAGITNLIGEEVMVV
jgi:hypothetical protein